MSVNIKPLEDRIVVKPLDAEQTTASGLVIPDTAKEKPQEGEVMASARVVSTTTATVSPATATDGDKVIYSKYAARGQVGRRAVAHPHVRDVSRWSADQPSVVIFGTAQPPGCTTDLASCDRTATARSGGGHGPHARPRTHVGEARPRSWSSTPRSSALRAESSNSRILGISSPTWVRGHR